MQLFYSLVIASLLLILHCQRAIAGNDAASATSGAQAQPTTTTFTSSETTVNPASPNSTASLTPTPVSQQTGVIQFNNSGLSALTYPNCGGACVFAIGRLVPTANNGHQLEAVAGVVWQFGSPENTQAQAQKMIAQAQSENLVQESNLTLAEKLADAIESGKTVRANAIAILLAKRLGYANYQQLLQDTRIKP